jgi:hypothetical protein
MLKASGWTVAPFVHGKPLAAQRCVAIEEYPTTAGGQEESIELGAAYFARRRRRERQCLAKTCNNNSL